MAVENNTVKNSEGTVEITVICFIIHVHRTQYLSCHWPRAYSLFWKLAQPTQ